MWRLSPFFVGDAYRRALFTPLRRSRRFHCLCLMAVIVMVMIVLPAWQFILNRFKCQAMARALHICVYGSTRRKPRQSWPHDLQPKKLKWIQCSWALRPHTSKLSSWWLSRAWESTPNSFSCISIRSHHGRSPDIDTSSIKANLTILPSRTITNKTYIIVLSIVLSIVLIIVVFLIVSIGCYCHLFRKSKHLPPCAHENLVYTLGEP